MAEQVTTIASQFYHNSAEPIDYSAEVDTFEDLADPNHVAPYKGKLVHVKADNKIYICAEGGRNAKWRPVMQDDGTAFYITNVKSDGTEEVFKITAVRDSHNTGRLAVTFDA